MLFCIFLCPYWRLKREHHSGDKKKRGCDIPFIYCTLIFSFVEMLFHTHTCIGTKVQEGCKRQTCSATTKKMQTSKKKTKHTHNSVKTILTKRKHQKLRRLDAAAGSKLVTKKIGQFCVCLFRKALISSFISSSTCGCLPAGLVVVAPRVDTHSHTHTPRQGE